MEAKRMNKKIFSILLSMILMVSMLSVPAFAEPVEGNGDNGEVKDDLIEITEAPELQDKYNSPLPATISLSADGAEDIDKDGIYDIEIAKGDNKGFSVNAVVSSNDVPIDNAEITFSSSNENAVRVNDAGEVTVSAATGEEPAVITAEFAGTEEYQAASAEIKVKVVEITPVPQPTEMILMVEGIEDNDGDGIYDIEINRGTEKSFTLNAKVTKDDAPVENAEVAFSSSDTNAVKVTDAGEVTVSSATEAEPAVITTEFAGNDEYQAVSATIRVNVEEWIPSVNKPSNLDEELVQESVVFRTKDENGSFGSLMILDRDLTDSDLDAIKDGQMDVWHGYKYKKANNNITTSIDESINEDGRYVVKYGSEKKDLEVKAAGEVNSASDNNAAVDVTDGIISVIDKVSDIVKITIEAAGDEFTKAAKRTIDVEVAKGDQVITVSKTSYSLPFGYKKFNLGAKSNASDAVLKYSSNNSAVAVDIAGNITIKNVTGSRTAVITIKSGETEKYDAAPAKTVSIKVTNPKAPWLTAKAIGGRKVQLSWTGVTGATKYQIQPYLGSKALKAKTVTSKSIKNTKLRRGRTYKYKVRAVVTANGRTIYGPWSNIRSVVVK